MRAVVLGLVATGLVTGFLTVFWLTDAGTGDAPTSSQEDLAELLQPYERSFISLWVRGCVSSGETRAFCRCAIDVYTTRLQPWEFDTATAIVNSGGRLGELPEHLRDVVKDVERDCR